MTNFSEGDREALLSALSPKDIVNSLTLSEVKEFLESLGVSEIVVNEDRGYICCPTICHNPIYEAESMKLYWYQDHKIFRCYTECDEAMSIFELYRRFMALNHYEVSLEEAIEYVKGFLHHAAALIPIENEEDRLALNVAKYRFDSNTEPQKEYSLTSLDCFVPYYHPLWLRDGIHKEVMDKFNIRFSLSQNKIVIPHFDINNRLIGIRARSLEEQELAMGRKYAPIKVGSTLYSFKLQFNLYGINLHKEAIKKRRIAIIAEAEKSVMLDDGYYGNLSPTVACCGSSFNKYQISLLTNVLGANEIVIALDKEYDDWRTEKAQKYRKHIEDSCRKFGGQAVFSYIWDYDNVLNEKDSPFDKGKEVFEHLFKTRVKIR